MTKTDLAVKVQELLGPETSKAAAENAVKAVLDAIVAGVKKDKLVQILGFGAFKVVPRAARTGKNPATGKPIKIKATKVLKFQVGSALKEQVAKIK
ncbi:MAG: HU family DNA-binding protein [Puniceicoccales bacterium]|jgi:DNA-binding protein HU-beta|nr:HU family DNA-binding protein [Puniceicoccales bacterium]